LAEVTRWISAARCAAVLPGAQSIATADGKTGIDWFVVADGRFVPDL
jgi:hypothetical protein